MDFQFAFLILLALLVGAIIVVTVYVVFVLKDFRLTLGKLNKVLDNVYEASDSVKKPLSNLSVLAEAVIKGFQAGKKVRSIVSFWDKNKSKDKEE